MKQSLLFRKANKINNPLVRLTEKKRRHKSPISKVKWDSIIDTADINWIKEYYEGFTHVNLTTQIN